MTKKKIIKKRKPNAKSKLKSDVSYLFGYESVRENSKVVLQQIPWEVTTSYGSGTSRGPRAILNASSQIDLFDYELKNAYENGYYLAPEIKGLSQLNKILKPLAQKIIKINEAAASSSTDGKAQFNSAQQAKYNKILKRINDGCEKMVNEVYEATQKVLAHGQIPGLIGGDHSTPLGAIKAICEYHKGEVGILHIDAHADLRNSYQGFHHSHASIMRNVSSLKIRPQKIVQVAIRDFCKEEYDFILDNDGFLETHFDFELKKSLFDGESWHSICQNIIQPLPQKVYVSFDIDGLCPEFCPHTGTPVPGGITFDQAIGLLSILGRSGREIVGFDLNEVAPGSNDEWDANVGSRMLFKLCGWAAESRAHK